jgi:hypothetical protein
MKKKPRVENLVTGPFNMQEAGVKVDATKFNYVDHEPLYAAISPLRALLLKDSDNLRYLCWT